MRGVFVFEKLVNFVGVVVGDVGNVELFLNCKDYVESSLDEVYVYEKISVIRFIVEKIGNNEGDDQVGIMVEDMDQSVVVDMYMVRRYFRGNGIFYVGWVDIVEVVLDKYEGCCNMISNFFVVIVEGDMYEIVDEIGDGYIISVQELKFLLIDSFNKELGYDVCFNSNRGCIVVYSLWIFGIGKFEVVSLVVGLEGSIYVLGLDYVVCY